MKNKIIIISGATATGKTDLSLKVAQEINGEIVNFDSLLFYQELNIGTAKPSESELKQIKHHMVNFQSICNPINAADYSTIALKKIQEIHQLNKTPILVGGSGFYLQALLNGMYPSITSPKEILQKSADLYNKEGIKPFLDFLKINDLESFKLYHENDHYRIRRAVEHFWTTQTKFSDARSSMDDELKNAPKNKWDPIHIYLTIPKKEHWGIIQIRTVKMIEQGLEEEVRNLLKNGFDANLKPLKSIGYKQTIQWINSEYKDQSEYIERIFIATRRLAKSQKTWFNKTEDKFEFHPNQYQDIIKLIKQHVEPL